MSEPAAHVNGTKHLDARAAFREGDAAYRSEVRGSAMAAHAPPSGARLACFTVGDWHVDPRSCRLSRGDLIRRVRPQLLDLLACLARRPGELVLKDEILAEVWPGQFIADSGITRCIAELRQALEDAARQPRYIEATRKRGYRLIAPVVWLEPAAAGAEGDGQQATPREKPAGAPEPAPASRRATAQVMPRSGPWVVLAVAALVVTGVLLTRSPAAVLTE